jgi:hypothetical protein
MTVDQQLEFETRPQSGPKDETDFSLRAYVARIPEEKLAEYDPEWTDEEVMEWDGNFRNDGALMLVCCERDVEVQDFRAVLEEFLQYRQGI